LWKVNHVSCGVWQPCTQTVASSAVITQTLPTLHNRHWTLYCTISITVWYLL